ncbi:MAG: hypothetical protein WC810_26340, partial [Janthinobacterium sp.]
MSSLFRLKSNLPGSFFQSKIRLLALLSIALLAIGLLVFGLWQSTKTKQKPVDNSAVVKLVGPRTIAVQPGSLLEQKFNISDVKKEQITTPLLLVTGAVVARLPAGSNPMEDRWQFNSIELSGVYADWQRARAEKEFNTKRLVKIRELTAAQYNSQKLAVERLRK